MNPTLEPFTTILDLDLGTLEPQRAATQYRYQRDMDGFFLASPPAPDELVYRVIPLPPPQKHYTEIACSTTIIEPGTVDGEYHMTKGHFHEKRDRSEIYIGLSGEGMLLQATEDGRTQVEPIRRGTVNYVPGGWGHRSVNTGSEPLVFFAAYIGDAGQDYATIRSHGFPQLVCADADGPVLRDNPRYARVSS